MGRQSFLGRVGDQGLIGVTAPFSPLYYVRQNYTHKRVVCQMVIMRIDE